jgi:dTDP-4-amino-4,6-dideoxygalactose transaminase
VITPSFTSIATINAIQSVGAHPVFVDIDETTYHIRPDLIEERISSRTRAILTVHLFGQMCEMDAIRDIAGRHGLMLIEDACQAIVRNIMGRWLEVLEQVLLVCLPNPL